MPNRTICLINDSFPPVTDGVANAVVNYARVITESGSTAVVATPAYPGADDSALGFPVVRYPSIDMTKLVGYHAGFPFSEKTMKTLMEYPFDLIHCHCPITSAVLARELRSRIHVPTVFTYHTKFDIDIANAIHAFAGVQLRAACAKAMAAQGHPEPTAQAKVTDAFNLPARYVIHTVGPIADGRPTDTHRRQLAECYRACWDAAAAAGLSSIAFCCISTGVFGFPQEEAASIAVATVRRWLDEHPDASMTVVFNVFSETDEHLYRPLLGL